MIALAITMNVLGILIYYFSKFTGRTDKTAFNVKFWLKENWIEFTFTLLINAVFMILLLHPETNVDGGLNTFLPSGVALVAKPTFSLLLGLGLALGIYKKVNKYTG